MNRTYLTTEELSERIKYDPRTIREQFKDSVLLEGIHYIRPFGGRKLSGVGQVNGETGVLGFTHAMPILIERFGGKNLPQGYP